MRSILGKKDNSKRNQLILGIGLIILMLFSTLGYALGGRNQEDIEKIEYNGIEFIQDSSRYWVFESQGYEFITQYNPNELEDINFNGNLFLDNYKDKELYFVGESQETISEIIRNLERFILRAQKACIDVEDCEEDLPIKDCYEDNIIITKEPSGGEEETIYLQGNCVFIVADFTNQTRYVDKFLFNLLGI